MLPWLISGLFLGACETVPTDSNRASSETVTASTSLPPQTLNVGDCGLFVWAGEARRFILFAQTGRTAKYASGGHELALTPIETDETAVSGDLYGQIPVQSFRDAMGRRYDLNLSHASEIQDGLRYSEGSWRYKNDEGWSVVTPVYGLSTCQA